MLFFPSYWKLSFISDAWQKTRHADDGHPGSDKHEKKKKHNTYYNFLLSLVAAKL